MSKKALFIAFSLMGISPLTLAENFCSKYDCERFADQIIEDDSRSWFFNRYDRGSAELVRNSVWESPSGLKTKYRVNYTYNGGIRGWAELELRDGEFYCIRYHDFPNDCRTGPKR
ncbi:hypothetical protein [Ursidibacter arcticus]